MKIRSTLLTGLALMALAGCGSSPAGGGGGLFGGGGTASSANQWDMMFLLQSPSCPLGFPGRGASVNPTFPGGYFPGVKVFTTNGLTSGDIPEVKALVYFLSGQITPTAVPPPPMILAGDQVKISFSYKTNADGLHGDYFLVRIADGDLFRVPVDVRADAMARNEWRQVKFSYQARGNGVALWFITGLGDMADNVKIDDLKISVNGVNVLTDPLNLSDYANPMPLIALPTGFVRFPLLPTAMRGSLAAVEGDAVDGVALTFAGGSYFTLDGMAGSAGGFSGIQLMYADPNPAAPFYGQTTALRMRQSFIGSYEGFDSSVSPTCTEAGQAIISVDPKGNADLSGQWALSLQLECGDPAFNLGDGAPAPYGSPLLFSQMMFFSGPPFTSVPGDSISGLMGLSLGDAGFFMMNSATTSAALYGVYDQVTGVFAGQIMGTVPVGGGVCEITSGQFVALISDPTIPPL